ncbi:MAG: ParB N-terminal domain-containing protein [Salaquimonas sp.]
MKRSIPRSILSKGNRSDVDESVTEYQSSDPAPINSEQKAELSRKAADLPKVGGAGSAWNSGALAQAQAGLKQTRGQIADDILNGRHEVRLAVNQISDPLGSDRRADWRNQEAFKTLKASIETNGQDTPILVWPKDPNWHPDGINPENVDGVEFVLLTGRRRHAVAAELGLPLRATLAPPGDRDADTSRFSMLFLRFRENEERENLGAFERLLSIGEMYESLREAKEGSGLTAVSFADRIGVHESIISRGRTVFKAREQILNAFKNAYEMSFAELQKAIASLDSNKATKDTKPAPSKKLTVKRKIGTRNLIVTSNAGKLAVSASGLKLGKLELEQLSELIAEFLTKTGAD